MLNNKKYRSTPIYGSIPKERTRFCDTDIFGPNNWRYAMLRHIILWYGTPKNSPEISTEKSCLGIQCVYYDPVSGSKKVSKPHCGELSSSDVEKKELELKEGDIFTKLNIGFETSITHLKFTSLRGEVLEIGKMKEELNKTILFNNEKEPHMIQCLAGYFNNSGLKGLGCKYISKKNYLYINLLGIFRLRHLFKNNRAEKEKWSDIKLLNSLNKDMKAVVKVCLLPDVQFSYVIKYCL